MASHYVHEDQRKHKYVTRAQTYYIKRITEPMDYEDRKYKSISKMSEELGISDYLIKSRDGILYLLKKPVKDLAISARLADDDVNAPSEQTFTSLYQLVKRFKVSYSTVAELRAMQPKGVECSKTIYDEFKRKYYLTFYK